MQTNCRSVLRTVLLVLTFVAGVVSANAQVSYLLMQLVQASGTRPTVEAQLNGKPFKMMVHANAGFYVMTSHAKAASIGLDNLKKAADYGISTPGHVDDLGMARATLSNLKVGESEAKDVPLLVFETPGDELDGMLGIE